MAEPNDKLDTIRALLRKASNPAATIEESESYNAKAAELMARYGIDAALLADRGEAHDEIVQRAYRFDGAYSRGRALLLGRIAAALRCRMVKWQHRAAVSRAVVVGFESDVERVDLLYTALQLQMVNQVKKVRPQFGEPTQSYRLSWQEGFSARIFHRLNQAEESAAAETTTSTGASAELVLVGRQGRVDAEYARLFPNLKKPKPRQVLASAWRDGAEAGEHADIGAKSVGGHHTQINA